MTPASIRSQVVIERVAWVRRMLDGLRALPLDQPDVFVDDLRNPAAAESFLRRALEGLMDLGRHVIAKGFGEGVIEYKAMAHRLHQHGVLSSQGAALLTEMAGYRNRLTHMYGEVTHEELRHIGLNELTDIEKVVDEILAWLRANPDRLDQAL